MFNNGSQEEVNVQYTHLISRYFLLKYHSWFQKLGTFKILSLMFYILHYNNVIK